MVGAIIVAAGNSSRMNGINKLFADINGKCVLARTLINFEFYSLPIRPIYRQN